MQLLTQAVFTLLNNASYKLPRTNIPNNHPALADQQEFQSNLAAVAQAVGFDLAATEFTFTVLRPKEKQDPRILQPSVVSFEGQAVLAWGKSKFPVSTLKQADFGQSGRDMGLLWDIGDNDEIFIPMRLLNTGTKEARKYADAKEVRSAYRAGKLGTVLAEEMVFASKLSEIPVGEYTIVDYKYTPYNSQDGYELETETGLKIRSNSYLNRLLNYSPEITHDRPAVMVTGEVTEYTPQGHPQVPILEFRTFADEQQEAFEF